MEAKTLPAGVCVFGHLGRLSPAAVHSLTTYLTLEWSGGSIFHPLSNIYAKTPFCCIETAANNALNRRCVVVFDRLWANAAPTLSTAFSLTNVHAKRWIPCLLISSNPLLSHSISIYDRPKRVCGVFFFFLLFSGTTAEFGRLKRSVSFMSLRPRLNSAYHLLNAVSDGTESE